MRELHRPSWEGRQPRCAPPGAESHGGKRRAATGRERPPLPTGRAEWYRFTTGDDLPIITYHCAEHGDVLPMHGIIMNHNEEEKPWK